jgi:putative integral membrane protein (TIGR02587 family)
VNFGVLLILQHYSGLHPRKTALGQFRAALVAMGMGIVIAAIVLLVLAVLRHDTALRDLVGKIALQSVPGGIGASIAVTHFDEHTGVTEARREEALFFPSIAIGIAGAMVFGFNLGATEEPMIVGEQLTWMHALGIVLLSLVVVFGISYAVGKRRLGIEPFNRKWIGFYVREALATYVVALLIAAYILWTFGRIDADTGLAPAMHIVISLGIVTALGATVGELLI